MTADQPLSENSTARGGVGGWRAYRHNIRIDAKKALGLLNSEGMFRRTDNFYFILVTFSFKLELILIN